MIKMKNSTLRMILAITFLLNIAMYWLLVGGIELKGYQWIMFGYVSCLAVYLFWLSIYRISRYLERRGVIELCTRGTVR